MATKSIVFKMIRYKSTRGDKNLYSFSEAIVKGVSKDGGLFVPERIPKFTLKQLKLLLEKTYRQQANFIFNLFKPDLSNQEVRKIVYKAYSSNFDTSSITPLTHLKNNQYILELWHGPTLSFKDLALQVMPSLFSAALEKRKRPVHHLILVATSGDTGKAALDGYKDKKNISIIVFYPLGRVSKLQQLQMITQEGSNVVVYGVRGDFDQVQTLVKNIFNDSQFNKKLYNNYQIVLSSANSINWGRIIPQIVYHVRSYIDLVKKQTITLGEKIDITIPTGNFGNILAAFYAKKMGLPLNKLICASNANNVLTEFLKTGVYDTKKHKLIKTPSPSMDILIANNIERLLYEITRSSRKVSLWMNKLNSTGKFKVDNATKAVLQKEFYADWVSNKDCLLNIKRVYEQTNYLMDPHTSVAQAVAERYIKQNTILRPVIICSTAHWSKFAKDIYKALINDKKDSHIDEFAALRKVAKLSPGLSIPKPIRDLQKKKLRFKQKCKADRKLMENLINNWVKKYFL